MKNALICKAIIGISIALLFSSCAGYNLEGRGSVLPTHILRVGVPTLENNTNLPSLGEIITREIYSEFINRSSFQVLSTDSGVDAVLEGEIISYVLIPRALDEEGVATSFLISVTANMAFRDLIEDTILWEQENYNFRREYQLSDISGDFVTQELESIRLAAKDFANSLVSSILSGF